MRYAERASGRWSVWTWTVVLLAGAAAIASAPDPASGDQPHDTTQPADASGASNHAHGAAGSGGLNIFWKDTLRIESPDKNFRLKIGGRFQGDWAVFDTRHDIEDDFGDFREGTEVRRARVYYSGTLYKRFEFKTQVELSKRKIEANAVYIGLVDLPIIGNLRLGHIKEPFGLSELTSSKYGMFMERPQTIDAFAPGRNTGIMLRNSAFGERMTWAVGFFRETDEFFRGEVSSGLHLTGRVTALPWYEENGRKLLHVGLAWSHQDPGGEDIGFNARPESHLAPKLADTGDILADAVDLVGLEAAWVSGSFSLQGEYVHAFVDRQEGSDLEFNSFYVQGSYIFTGEHRHYSTDVGVFGRIRPTRNVGEDGGMGAWEAALRYSYLDLNDADILGGRVSDLTAGLNWYLNPNTRVSWNYVYSDVQDHGFANIFQMRLQVAL